MLQAVEQCVVIGALSVHQLTARSSTICHTLKHYQYYVASLIGASPESTVDRSSLRFRTSGV